MKYYTSADLKAILKKFDEKMDELKAYSETHIDDRAGHDINYGFCNGIRKAKEELKLICDSELKE